MEKKQPEKLETNCHFGTLFGTGIVEAKPLEKSKKTSLFGAPSNLHCLVWSLGGREVTLSI